MTFVKLLGPPGIEWAGRWHEPPRGKTAGLFYYLAYQGGWVGRGDALYLFWPDIEEKRARGNLRQMLSAHRQLPYLEALETDRTRLRWSVPTDVGLFREAVAEGRWSKAEVQYQGALLEGFGHHAIPEFETWLELERASLVNSYRDAAFRLAEEHEAAARYLQAADIFHRLHRLDPLDEEAFRHYLEALARAGRKAEVFRAFDTFQATLQREVEGQPERATHQLVEQIRAGTLPQHHRGGTKLTRFTALPNLPTPATPFVGRERELSDVTELLEEHRLVTLLGPGGIGKTRLAIEAAHHQRSAYRDGVQLVPLASTTTLDGVAPTMAQALDITLHKETGPLEQVVAFLRNRETLLVLDNLEHLLGMPDVVRRLLEAAAGVRVLATSRARLNLGSEQVVELRGLSFPTAGGDGDLGGFDAVRFFVSRAQRFDRGFDLTTHAGDIVRICSVTAGMPLALEFASAWLRVLPLAEVVSELARGLDLLEATEADAEARHGSVRQVFDTSWELLQQTERGALLALSVFRGGFTRDAAREVAGAGLPMLLALRNNSFLEMDASGRFSQHPLVETYVRERAQLGSVDVEEAKRSHAEYFFAFLERQETFRVTAERDNAITEVARERGNLQASWQWAAERRREDLFAGLDSMITTSFQALGYEDELAELIELALTRIPEGSRGWARLVLSSIELLDQGAQQPHKEAAHELLRGASEALQRHGDARGTARSLDWLGISAAHLNRHDEARRWWQQAREQHAQLGNRAREALILNFLMVATTDPTETERLFHEADTLFEQTDAVYQRSLLLRNYVPFLSRTYGRYDLARTLLDRGRALAGEVVPYERGRILWQASTLSLNRGDLADAEEQAHEALQLMRPFDTRTSEQIRREIWIHLARVALARADVKGAAEIAERTGDTALRVRIALLHGDHQRARQLLFEEDLDRLWRTDVFPRQTVWLRINTLLLAAEVESAAADSDAAWEHLREALGPICELVFVPSALEAFVVAAPLLSSDEAEALLTLAATHPASTFETRQRARSRMTADPIGVEPATPTPEEILERARSLLEA